MGKDIEEFVRSQKVGADACVRVDGAGDEGPSHKEVAFLWAEKHRKQNHKLTCVTTRYSGGTYEWLLSCCSL